MDDPDESRHGSRPGQPADDREASKAPSEDSGGPGGGKPTVSKKWILYMAATVIPLTIAVYAGVEIAARRAMDDARQLWQPRLGNAEQLLDRYPHREANASALRLEQLALPLGICLAPRSFLDRAEPAEEAIQAYRDVKRTMWTYVDGQVQSPEMAVPGPPDALVTYLDAHRAALADVRSHLLEAPAPVWELHLERLWKGPLPNIVGHASLQRLLLADTLAKLHDGDHAAALDSLEAGWRLNRAIADDPMVMTQLVGIAVARFHSSILRKAAPVPAPWRERLHAHDYSASLSEALRVEGWMLAHTRNLSATLPDEFSLRRLFELLKLPYTKLDTAGASQILYSWSRALEKRDSLCPAGDGLQLSFESVQPLPHRRLAGIYLPEVRPSIDRVGRLLFDTELTDRWLAVAAAASATTSSPAAAGGDAATAGAHSWPAPLPPQLARSSLCPSESWTLDVASAGESATLRFSRPDLWKTLRGPTQPTEMNAKLSDLEGRQAQR
jgi:hypothetical protein